MRTHTICLALGIVLICPFASAQSVQINGINERQVPHHPLMSTNVSQETHSELLRLTTQHRLQPEFLTRLDSLRASRMRLPFSDGRFVPNGIQRSASSLQRMSSLQSQVYVIDTAIVRSTSDTTRHLYSFNANGKMTSDYTQKFGGDLWVDIGRETYTYDAGNRMLTHLFETPSDSQWVLSAREWWIYDAAGNTLSDSLEYVGLDGQWSLQYRSTSTYDEKGNQLTYVWEGRRYGWGKASWWVLEQYTYTYDTKGQRLTELYVRFMDRALSESVRYTYGYDVNGRMVLQLQEVSVGARVGTYRYTYTYDASNNLLSRLEEFGVNGQWANELRVTYTYDASTNMLSYLNEYWSNGQWLNDERHTYTYGPNGNETSDLREVWSTGQWVNSWRYTYTYDATWKRMSFLVETWSNGQWLNNARVTYSYDANGNKLSELYESWSTGQWVNSQLYTYTYDAHGNLTSFSQDVWLDSYWERAPLDQSTGISLADSAGNDYSYVGYYFTFTRKLIVTGVAPQSGNVPAVYSLSQNYPNPFNPTTKIQFSIVNRQLTIVKVYDVLGRDVATLVNEVKQPGTYTVEFDGSNLASGVYFYRLQAGDFVQTKRLLLLK